MLLGAGIPLPRQEGRFNDEVSMARAADGAVYVAWNGFRDGADALMVARCEWNAGALHPAGCWEALGGPGTYILHPKVVAAGDRVYLLYAAERGRNWDIYALPVGAAGPGRPIAVSAGADTEIHPAGAWHRGTLWAAWESNRGGARRIYAAAVRDGRAGRPEEVAAAGNWNNYGPSLVVESNGGVAVAWHSFRGHNYDVYLRRRSVSGRWGRELRLTTAPTMDRHPVLALHKDELWVFYENSRFEGYQTGIAVQHRAIAAKVTPRGLLTPAGSPLYTRGEAPSPAFDSAGRLWLAYLQPRLPRAGWEVWFTGFTGERWESPRALTTLKGMDRRPALVIDGLTALVAFQYDDFPPTWAHDKPELTANAKSRILLYPVDLRGAAPAASAMRLEPLVEPAQPFEAAGLRVSYGEDTARRAIDYQGRKLRLLFGDLHTHSDISVCVRCGNMSVEENYQVRRDLNRLDFACVTDHGYNVVPYLWNHTAKMARANEDPGRMQTFLAQEWTSSFKKGDPKNPYGYYGHRNLILADPFFPRWWNANLKQNPAELWAELRKMKANFVHIPHQIADTGNVPTDWSFVDETAQPVAEIFQGRGSYEYLGAPRRAERAIPRPGWYMQDVWARGTAIGVIASPDHYGGLGKAAVYAPDMSRESIIDAIRARHTYGTTAARIALEVRVNGRLMGEKIPASGGKPVEVKVRARCPGDIDRIEICRSAKFLYVQQPTGKDVNVTFLDTDPIPGYSYYYVRVMQKDKEIAWSSPVFLGAN